MTTQERASIESVSTWHVAPEDQGQTIERAYGADWESEILWLRETDQSIALGEPGRVSYYRADADILVGKWEPWNGAPEVDGWQRGRVTETPTPADLRAWRKRAGLTQERAGKLAGVERLAWARWELGTRPVPQWLRDTLLQRWGSAP